VCELVDWQGAEPPTAAALEGAGIRRGVVPPATVLLALATSHAEYAVNPIAAQQRLLADIGLIAAPDFGSPLGFDPRHIGAMTEAIHSLETGDGAVTEKVRQFARQHKPALLEPVTQFALRREQKKSELPARRVQRLKLHRTPAQPLGEWMVFRWHELDDALRDTFGVA
jgi:rhamnose utilization protein RhaD (predicted bifunctional aldolase and dehydrogenase)